MRQKREKQRPLSPPWPDHQLAHELKVISRILDDNRAAVRAQLFTTGPQSLGYAIGRISIDRAYDIDEEFLGPVALYTTDAEGKPDLVDGLHATLILERTAEYIWELAAPDGMVLEPTTTYALVFLGDGGTYPVMWTKDADTEDGPD